jgi:serpin B
MLFDLTNENMRLHGQGESPIHIANAIFVDRNLTLRQDFAQTFLDFFRGEVMSVDFTSPLAVEAVNQWASYNTNGLIPEVVRHFDPNTVAAITNAIYFSGYWWNRFDPDNTVQDIFHSPAGEVEAYFMRHQMLEFNNYFEDERLQALNLEFDTGAGMYILLPMDGDAAGLLSSMTAECFERIHSESARAQGTLALPKFAIENEISNLKDALIALGIPLFCEISGPLTGLIEDAAHLWVSEAVQVAMIEVDEDGATAAAVTMMDVADSAPPPPEIIFEMICDRPFAFILHSRTQDGGRQILFMGVVNSPG